MEEHYRNYRINSSSFKSETGWSYQTTVEEWVDVGSDFNVTHWSAEHPFESAAKAEEAGLAWAKSMIDSGEIRGLKAPPKSP